MDTRASACVNWRNRAACPTRIFEAGGVMANRIARWNDHVWSALGGGLFGYGPDLSEVRALEAFGRFTQVGNVPANDIAMRCGCPR